MSKMLDNEMSMFSYRNGSGVEKIKLLDNGKFEYRISRGLIQSSCNGTWQVIKDSLFLTTNEKFGIVEATESTETSDTQSLHVQVLEMDDTPIVGLIIQENDKKENSFITDEHGETVIYGHIPLEIKIEDSDNTRFEYKLKDKSKNKIGLKMNLMSPSTCYKENECYKVYKNKLVSQDGKIFKRE